MKIEIIDDKPKPIVFQWDKNVKFRVSEPADVVHIVINDECVSLQPVAPGVFELPQAALDAGGVYKLYAYKDGATFGSSTITIVSRPQPPELPQEEV